MGNKQKILEDIAREELGIETLDTTIPITKEAVLSIKRALELAYKAGKKSKKAKGNKTESERLLKKFTPTYSVTFQICKTAMPFDSENGVGEFSIHGYDVVSFIELFEEKTMLFTKKEFYRVFYELFNWVEELGICIMPVEFYPGGLSITANRVETAEGLPEEDAAKNEQLYWITYHIIVKVNGQTIEDSDLELWFGEFYNKL